MPIAGAKVEIFKDSELLYTGYTDENGRFTKMLEAGTYKVRISKEGYVTIEKTETVSKNRELMVNLPSLSLITGLTYDINVLGGVDKTVTIMTEPDAFLGEIVEDVTLTLVSLSYETEVS